MIRRARNALPGVVVSMLLAAPALATQAKAIELQTPVEHRKTHSARSTRQHVAHAPHRTRPAETIRSAAVQRPARPADTRLLAFLDDDAAPDMIRTASGRTGRFVQTGMASWYGGQRWQGRPTSSGAPYDEEALTAAHATLPLGTRVRVALAGADRDVVVTINDRQGTRARVIDLSRAAARQLGILDKGIARVIVTEL